MRDITDEREIEEMKEELLRQRLKEQEDNKDYEIDWEGEYEECHTCGTFINTHGHCPRCDY